MQTAAERQFNTHFSIVAPEYFGKDGSARFTNGGKRFTATKLLSAALLGTRQTVWGDGCKTSYADFEAELHFSRSTTAKNVAELTHSGAFERKGQSKYVAAYSVDTKHGLPVYHFLRTEEFNGKRLSCNAVLYLSYLIRFYLNPDREQKYFVGGEKRAAKTINAPQSTAHGFVDELLYAGVMQRFQLHDGKLSEGKGINSDYLTVYVVSDKILKAVKAIRKQIERQKADMAALKNLFASANEKRAAREQAPTEGKRRKPSLLDQWQSTFEALQARAKRTPADVAGLFENDFTYNQLKRNFKELNGKYFVAIRQSGGQDTPETQDLEKRLDVILSDVLHFLEAHNVRREELPDDWKSFVQSMLYS